MMEAKPNKARLLMFDDDPEDALLVQTALKRIDICCAFQYFQTSAEFSDYLDKEYSQQAQESPIMLLLDLNMAAKTGLEWLQELRANKRFDDLIIIVFSTSDMVEERTRSLALGANAHIGKPDSVNELAHRLKGLYRRWIDRNA